MTLPATLPMPMPTFHAMPHPAMFHAGPAGITMPAMSLPMPIMPVPVPMAATLPMAFPMVSAPVTSSTVSSATATAPRVVGGSPFQDLLRAQGLVMPGVAASGAGQAQSETDAAHQFVAAPGFFQPMLPPFALAMYQQQMVAMQQAAVNACAAQYNAAMAPAPVDTASAPATGTAFETSPAHLSTTAATAPKGATIAPVPVRHTNTVTAGTPALVMCASPMSQAGSSAIATTTTTSVPLHQSGATMEAASNTAQACSRNV